MNLLKRLKNLWKLSEWEPSSDGEKAKELFGQKYSMITQKPKPQIIKRQPKDVIDEINGD
jgi:hypothetical protein